MKKVTDEIRMRMQGLGLTCDEDWTLYDVAEHLRDECDIHLWVETRFDGAKEHLYYIGVIATVNGGGRMLHTKLTPECDDHDTALIIAIGKALTTLSEY